MTLYYSTSALNASRRQRREGETSADLTCPNKPAGITCSLLGVERDVAFAPGPAPALLQGCKERQQYLVLLYCSGCQFALGQESAGSPALPMLSP